MKKVTVKENDIVEFLAISWDEPQWEFDYPTVLLQPVLQYSPNGDHPETMIEDAAIDLSFKELEDEDFSAEEGFYGWKLKTLKRVAKRRLAGHDDWKTKVREVIYQKIQFVINEDGELEGKVLETKRA